MGYRLGRAPLVVAAAAACLVLYARDPADGAPYPACPFRAITGLDCPFCGLGRAAHAVLHGDVARAFGFNPLFFVLPFLGLGWMIGKRPGTRAVWLVVGALALFAVVRNLPFTAVSWMASYR